jgi:ribosomal protein S18 acetylase RimI-like enzyme
MPRLGADRAFLDVMLVNQRAQRAYRSVGFGDAGLTPADQSRLIDLAGCLDDGVAIMRVDRGTLRAPDGPTVAIVE